MSTRSFKDFPSMDAQLSSEQIARRIDETRTGIDHTLDALQARLSPSQILSRTAASVRARGRASLETATHFAKNKPMAAFLVALGTAAFALGLAGLLIQRWRSDG